jgi:Ser/Thr protein kinase RdoA (MazF antagonist)
MSHQPQPSIVPVAHSLIAPHALARLADEAFGLVAQSPPRLLQARLNDHYALATAHGDYVLRVYRHGWRTDEDVTWELGLLDHLRRAQAAVAASVLCCDGRLFATIDAPEGVRQVAVFERAPGPYTHFGSDGCHRVSPATCAEAFGRSVGKVHAAADSYHAAAPRFALDLAHLIDQPLAAIAASYAHRPHDVAVLQARAITLRGAMEPRLRSANWGACHGDMSGGNSTFWRGKVVHFDFDCGGPGWRAYDLGVFFWSLTINGHGDEVWLPFLEGYRTEHAIADGGLALVPAFAAARVLWLQGLWCANADRFGSHTLHDDAFDRTAQRFASFLQRALPALAA